MCYAAWTVLHIVYVKPICPEYTGDGGESQLQDPDNYYLSLEVSGLSNDLDTY